ncbi:MAG: MFS transporter [Pseudomonadota bacterium]
MLVLVYAFNFIDRQIISILAVPIKADLGLSDTQLGVMSGLAFALFYTTLGIPIAWLADRRSRVWILSVALTAWSAMTALCGIATSFWQLFFARLGVGVGEAGGVAPSHSLICDYFPPRERGRALALYAFGVPIGSALGIVFGGVIATRVDWRYAFFVVGIAGVLLAPLLRLTVREPARGRFDQGIPATPLPFGQALRELRKKPSFWWMALGASSASIMGYGVFFWLPSFLVRSFGLSLLDASFFYGGVLLIGGLAGIWGGGAIADRLGAVRRSAYVQVPAVAFFCAGPLYALAVLSTHPVLTFFLLLPPMALGLAWLGPVMSAVQQVVRPGMRASASAVFLFLINLIGLGGGTTVLGVMSDVLTARFGDEALRYAIISGAAFYLIACGLFMLAARFIETDWEHVESQNS